MIPFAQMCSNLHVEALSVGLELIQVSTNPQTLPFWRQLISDIRNVYKGQLTYCSIMYPFETQDVLFWDLLDFIAMDTYVPMMRSADDPLPTLNSMIYTFSSYFSQVFTWLQSQPQNIRELPFVLTEIGYPSCIDGMVRPYASPESCDGSSASNFTLQSMAFSAFFDTMQIHELPIEGVLVFWIDMPGMKEYYPDRATNNYACGWTPRYKPAECVIAQAFGGICTNSTVAFFE